MALWMKNVMDGGRVKTGGTDDSRSRGSEGRNRHTAGVLALLLEQGNSERMMMRIVL